MNGSTELAIGSLAALPWLLLTLLLLPVLLAAWLARTFPTLRWIALLSVACVLSVVTVQFPAMLAVVIAADVAAVALAALDFFTLPPRRWLSAHRQMPRTASLGAPLDVELTLENRGPRAVRGALRDDLPEGFESHPEEHPLTLPGRWRVTFQHRLKPLRRGAARLEWVYIRAHSRLGLWQRHIRLPVKNPVNVYPDMKQLSEYALLARTDRLSLIGVRRTRRIGQDSDFERLRDYSRDDNYRHIDWRSTARRNKLTVRQYQTDQSQRVVFLLDCGRMMTNEAEGLSLLDHALNACLMLGYVALEQGDSVGMLCFSDTVHAYVPPAGGRSQMNRLLHAGYDQFPRLVESRYDQAFLYLSNHCRRRSLVVLATNLIDEVNAAQVSDYLGNLVGRHLPLGVLMRDHALFHAADAPGSEPDQLYQAAAAAQILVWRHQVIQQLRHRGALALDVFPEDMTAPLVNQYLQVKAQHLL